MKRGEPLTYPKGVSTSQGTSLGSGWRDPDGRRWVHVLDEHGSASVEERHVPEVLSQGWKDLLADWDEHLA